MKFEIQAKCNECDFKDEVMVVVTHCKKSKHVMIDGVANYSLIDIDEVIKIWKYCFTKTIITYVKTNWDYIRECVEIDNKELNKIEGDMIVEVVDKYSEKKLKSEIITAIENLFKGNSQ